MLLERHAPKPGFYGAWADAVRILGGAPARRAAMASWLSCNHCLAGSITAAAADRPAALPNSLPQALASWARLWAASHS